MIHFPGKQTHFPGNKPFSRKKAEKSGKLNHFRCETVRFSGKQANFPGNKQFSRRNDLILFGNYIFPGRNEVIFRETSHFSGKQVVFPGNKPFFRENDVILFGNYIFPRRNDMKIREYDPFTIGSGTFQPCSVHFCISLNIL
jgi:hypothetical protein